MRSSLDSCQHDIAEMRAMASAIRPANVILSASSDAILKQYLSVRRRFDYSALIIALYASFEIFVEDILSSFTRTLAGQKSYASLPTTLTTKHLRKTAELLTREIDPIRYPGVSPHQLIQNLNDCLSGHQSYRLNDVAVAAHERNLRFQELATLLNLVDIDLSDVCRADDLVSWYYNEQAMTGPMPHAVPKTVVQQRLDNFVQRRNDVAHRGGNPSDRLGIDEMQELLDFVQALCRSIFRLFVASYLNELYVGAPSCEKLQLTRGPYRKQKVWIVSAPAGWLYRDQPAFAFSDSFLVRWGRILSLQIDDQDVLDVAPGIAKDVGVQLTFSAPATAKVFVVAGDDTAIWPPLRTP